MAEYRRETGVTTDDLYGGDLVEDSTGRTHKIEGVAKDPASPERRYVLGRFGRGLSVRSWPADKKHVVWRKSD